MATTAHRRRRSLLAVAGGLLLATAAAVTVGRVRRRVQRERVRSELGGYLPRVVIVGGGAAGLFTALELRDAPVETVLIDRVNHYRYEALLYQVATGQLDEDEVSLPLRDELGSSPNTTVLLGEVDGIDLERREVHLRTQPHSLLYDYLVVATGLEPDYFGHDEWARFAPPLKTLADALRLRDRFLASFEEAERSGQPGEHPELRTFVIVGGGPTGVEMAGALAEMVRVTPADEFKRFDPHLAHIVLLEAGDRLLPTFSGETSRKVRERLEASGIEVRLGQPVESIDAEGVVVSGDRIASRNVVWAAGTRATPIGRVSGLPTDEHGRIVVGPDLAVIGRPEAFAVGDVARFEQGGRALPGIAPVALEEAHYVGKAITRRVAGLAPSRPFRYVDRGTVAAVGRGYGVLEAMNGRIRMTGFTAKLVWIAAHVLFQVPFGDKTRMATTWPWASLRPRLRARVITGPESAETEAAERELTRAAH